MLNVNVVMCAVVYHIHVLSMSLSNLVICIPLSGHPQVEQSDF